MHAEMVIKIAIPPGAEPMKIRLEINGTKQ
jgi:hypothetical protein